jgi:hypothetical protein
MMSNSVLTAFGLRNANDSPFNAGQPIVDVVFMWWIDERFTMTAEERENLEALIHDCFLPLPLF